MTATELTIGRATEADISGILELLEQNLIVNGGALSASLPHSRVEAMMNEMPQIVARRGDVILGFLLTSTRKMNADLPIIQAMFAAYEGAPDAYIYGPACVGGSARGAGVAQKMFGELRRLEPGREGILFIRTDNQPSLRAHARMGMKQVAEFQFNGADHWVFSFIG